MNVYSHLTYQAAVLEAVELKRSLPGKWTLKQLADDCGLQASFVTNVLKGRLEFNADQLFDVSGNLGFSVAEKRYLLLLLDCQRSSHKVRKQELRSEIDAIRAENKKTEKHISAKTVELSTDSLAEYYLDPFIQIVHVHLSLSDYTSKPEALSQLLGISKIHLSEILNTLVRIGYVKLEKAVYKVIVKNRHLAKDSPLCGPHQALMRLKSIDQLQRLSPQESYAFSATISGNEETRAQLHEAFLGFLKKAESIVKIAPSEKVFQMNFDLFPWRI